MKREMENKLTFLDNYTDPIVVEKGKALKLIEWIDETTTSQKNKRDFILEEGSTLEYLKISTINKDCSLEIDFQIKLNKSAKANIHLFELGSGESINRIQSVLDDSEETIFINSLVHLDNTAKVFNSFDIIHNHSNTYSDLQVRHLLDGESKAEFEAKTIIENSAVYSKAFQNSKTILLSDNATIKARPHLEILVDELEASHGAVTGGLDENSLYYLRSRGLSENEAKKILLDAFCLKVIENIQDASIKEWLKEAMDN